MKKDNRWCLGLAVAALCAALGTGAGALAQTRGHAAGGAPAAAARAGTAAPAQAASGAVNLNSASAEELERLPGVGPAKAAAILALRQRMGRFQRVEDVLRVRGIGRATFRRLRPMLTLQGPTTLTETPRVRQRADDGEEAP